MHVKFLKLLFQKTIKTCTLEVKEGQAVYTLYFNLTCLSIAATC